MMYRITPALTFLIAAVLGGAATTLLLSYPSTPPVFSNPETVMVSSIKENPEALAALIAAQGIDTVMARLVEESDGGSIWDCHQPAHEVGRVGYGLVGADAFSQCNASCHSGCYHGAIEVFLQERGTQNIAGDITELCNTFPTRFGRFECLHGVGHGVTAFLNYDIPAAIESCRRLDDWFSTRSCFGGLFMENILTGQGLGARGVGHTTDWVSADPHFPCNGIDQDRDVQEECYMMQTSWMLWINGYDFAALAAECQQAPQELQSTCFQSYGRDAAGHTLRNADRIAELCLLVPDQDDWRQRCTVGAVNVIVDFWGPNLTDQASELCHVLPESQKSTCYAKVAQRIRDDLFPDTGQRAVVCQTFEPSFTHLCL